MRALTESEACAWCVAHRIALDERQHPQPKFAESQGRDFKIPGDTGRRIALLSGLFRSIPNEQEILLWFTGWGVWPSSERTCLSVFVTHTASTAGYRMPRLTFQPI